MDKQQLKDIKPKQRQVKMEKFNQNGWDFEFSSSGIMPSVDLDQLSDYLILNVIPEVVFHQNIARIVNKEHNFILEINPRESLRFTNFKARDNRLIANQSDLNKKSKDINHVNVIPNEVKVKQAEVWKNKKLDPEIQSEIKNLEQFSDCFFATGYKGTIRPFDLDPKNELEFFRNEANTKIDLSKEVQEGEYPYTESTNEDIPLHNLTEKNPIKWHTMIHLWEDELGDNGSTTSEFRFRVMGDCFFGLLRHYMRVDDVLIRIYDTRIYHDFKTNYILREFTIKEDSYADIAKRGFQFTPKWMIDEGQSFMVQNFLNQKYSFKEKIFFKK